MFLDWKVIYKEKNVIPQSVELSKSVYRQRKSFQSLDCYRNWAYSIEGISS